MTRLNWQLVNRRETANKLNTMPRIRIKMAADASFWRAWQDDKEGMRAAGYRPVKIDGKWKVYIEK